MNVSVILAHPHPGSFNHAIAKTATATLRESGHRLAFHDLYAEQFDPILPYGEIRREVLTGLLLSYFFAHFRLAHPVCFYLPVPV